MTSKKESPKMADVTASSLVQIRLARDEERTLIYQSRHNVYADELGQHSPNSDRLLMNDLDDFNTYIVAMMGETLAGYVSITPPGQARYSLDGYMPRENWPFEVSDTLYEIRLLTVVTNYRGSLTAAALMFAAFRYIQESGGTRIMATGRREVASIYRRVGLRDYNMEIQSGKVTYLLMGELVSNIQDNLEKLAPFFARMKHVIEWKMGHVFWPYQIELE